MNENVAWRQHRARIGECREIALVDMNKDLADGEARAYRDPVAELSGAAAERYRGSWVATFAPVIGTDFVVLVQQR